MEITYFKTKLKRTNPPTPRYAPIQSTFPPGSDFGESGTNSSTPEYTNVPNIALQFGLH